jgi:NAD(P)-dependent dehydrogenase (short-subunit alcohol dehydrogenase family)
MTGRDSDKSRRVRDQLAAEAQTAGGEIAALHTADFAVLKEVRRMAEEIRETHPDLQVLVNNAGIQTRRRTMTPEGLEMVFTVNHLAPFLLTNLLLPVLQNNQPARIVNVSSMVHEHASLNLEDPQLTRGWEAYRAYSQSKLANVLFTRELAERLEGTGVTVNALHPGVISTKLLHTMFSGGASPEKGARTSVYLAESPEVEGVTGRYFRDRRPARSPALEGDGGEALRLWELSERLTGLAD